jgi:hypothetical protein
MKNLVLSCTLALATSLVAATAWSADTAPPTDASKSKIVCKNEATLGSRLPHRVCKTQAQLDQEKQNAKEATNEFQRDGSQQLEKGS